MKQIFREGEAIVVRLGDFIEGDIICAKSALCVIAIGIFLEGKDEVGNMIDRLISGVNTAGNIVGNKFLGHGVGNFVFSS